MPRQFGAQDKIILHEPDHVKRKDPLGYRHSAYSARFRAQGLEARDTPQLWRIRFMGTSSPRL